MLDVFVVPFWLWKVVG